jgi:hypothetical protein
VPAPARVTTALPTLSLPHSLSLSPPLSPSLSLPLFLSLSLSFSLSLGGRELFRERYGAHAGWAHSVLFAAELPLFRPLLPDDLLEDMAVFRAQGKAARQLEKEERAAAKAEGRKYVRPAAAAEAEAAAEGASDASGSDEAAPPDVATKGRKATKRRRPKEVD